MTEPRWTEKDAQTLPVPSAPATLSSKRTENTCKDLMTTACRQRNGISTCLNCLSREASAYKGSNHAPMTSLNTKTHQLAPQQGGCFITNRSEKKDSKPRETLSVIKQPQLQINWPITVSRLTEESEKQ